MELLKNPWFWIAVIVVVLVTNWAWAYFTKKGKLL